jgi:hypothetical protein
MVCCRDATASSFVAKVWGEFFAHFHAVAVKYNNGMQNWLFGLPGQILCEQPPCSWLCTSPVSPFSVLVSLDMPFKNLCTAHALFPERLLIIARISLALFFRDFHKIWCTVTVPLSDMTPNKRTKKSAYPPSCVKFCTLTPKVC